MKRPHHPPKVDTPFLKSSSIMALKAARSIHLPKRLYNLLKRFARKRNSLHWLVQRSRIILWLSREIAIEASKRGIVASISERSVNRLLAEMDLKPHRSRYWLNATPDCPETFKQRVMEGCEVMNQPLS
ncbi:MAG: hypothetical protein AAGD25_40735 [Cyanobacteria bacterium P01_F01_bin.150]